MTLTLFTNPPSKYNELPLMRLVGFRRNVLGPNIAHVVLRWYKASQLMTDRPQNFAPHDVIGLLQLSSYYYGH